ncbi:D-alanyl-D-alanine carboxypeptidase [Clostridium cavendishii DSM 21758]|uniref:D-alanyl-D-alanine carboxypeptidase n=1 Tax=Clostridium cavendishii DSM 21758 TaxID=1121302 RepID=A0A1M6VBW0_9CLOT|nr:D-alanyl-D-alanine carboxypeptidase family protein [Clostridium cavendishii]SHK78939.1 D-alanyl-D-alanine carboxypeptidase [Clostridium cavendishii DSM 21758]
MIRKRILTSLIFTIGLTLISPLATTTAKAAETTTKPTLAAKYAVSIDYETGELIYTKGIDEKAYPASTTKVLTALLFAENKQKTDVISYPESGKNQPDASLYVNFKAIKPGDTMTGDDVMKALLLFSANDSACMIADAVSGSESSFIDAMNKKVADLHLKNTHFATVNGLHSPEHYTTAYDMSIIAKEAFHNDWVRETMGTKDATIAISNGKTIKIENRNKFLGKNGNIGGKTGFTTPAGKCLVSIYERDGRKMVGVVFKSDSGANDDIYFKDMEKMMDYSYGAKRVVDLKKGTELEKLKLEYKPLKFFGPTKTIEVPLTLEEDVTYYKNEINDKETTRTVNLNNNSKDLDAWTLAKNSDKIKLDVKERAYSKSYNVKADINTSKLITSNIILYFIVLAVIILAIALVLFIISSINKGKRSKGRRKKGIF